MVQPYQTAAWKRCFFFETNSTVVCSKHFRKEDVRKSLTGRWFLVPGLSFSICFCLTLNANVLLMYPIFI